MAGLIVLIFILGCAAYLYLKSTLADSLIQIIITLCAAITTFAWFEALANVFISRGPNVSAKAAWAQPLSFLLLFIITFAVLRIIAGWLIHEKIDLGLWPERVGRVVCGIFQGLLFAGILLTALALAPLSNKQPYQRFAQSNPNAESPSGALFNADGFVTGWFNTISSGSLSGKKSFATLHADFLDQTFLNRHKFSKKLLIVSPHNAIKIPAKNALWHAPAGLQSADPNSPLTTKSAHQLVIARIGIKLVALRQAGTFTLSQLRMICKAKGDDKEPFAGRGKTVFPIGYIQTANHLRTKRLNDQITAELSDPNDDSVWIDFAFYIPNDSVPVLIEFKQNNIFKLPPLIPADQAPEPVPFIESIYRKQEEPTETLETPSPNDTEPAPLIEAVEREQETPETNETLSRRYRR
ncbi:MAG: CvpA family protein [Planctomycetota bacterium]|jgi:hypothetical protein